MSLTSPRFASNQQLQRAAENRPPLRRGFAGQSVRLLQQALMDSGFTLPASTSRHNSPDGLYGRETFEEVKAYQRRHTLSVDGIAGRQTLNQMDSLLRGPATPLPLLPVGLPYTVPGTKVAIKQQNPMSCWAASYTMMVSWRQAQSMSVEQAVTELGPEWLQLYRQSKTRGLSANRHNDFARAAGLRAEPLMNFSMEGWIHLLRRHGLLWTVYGWRSRNMDGTERVGRHAVIIYGMYGDGTPERTTVRYINPTDGGYHEQTFERLIGRHETGFTVGSGEQAGFSQVLHY